MKKVMFGLCFMFGGIVMVTAQDTTSNQYRTETETQYSQDARTQGMQQDRERIQSTDLPDEVKRTLEGEEYRGWLISGAFKAKAGDDASMQSDTDVSGQGNQEPGVSATTPEDEEVYIVELKNGAETKTLTFDKDGQEMEGMDNSQPGEFNQNNQYNQGQYNQDQNSQNQNNQYNQNDQYNQPAPGQTDPTQTTPDQQGQWDQPTESPDQPIQTPETPATPDDQSLDQGSNQSWENQSPGQPTETQGSQPAQHEQPGSDTPR